MAVRRPIECPECGHERLRSQRTPPGVREAREPRVKERWMCGLCSYEWLVMESRAPMAETPLF
jgi:DNA-directed RNA polymerase subunit RPC12/RpoP